MAWRNDFVRAPRTTVRPLASGKPWRVVCGIVPLAMAVVWVAMGMTLCAAPEAQPPATKSATRQPTAPAALPHSTQLAYTGAGSCASSACHGGSISFPMSWRNSFSVWATRDRHARAYGILFNDLARQIIQKLDRLEDLHAAKAFEDRRCLGCHSAGIEARQDPHALRTDGVSCEACHGPAEKWLVAHTLMPSLQAGEAEKARQATGMTNTKDIQVAASTCVKCHVGAPPDGEMSYEVNHDLIAAGHPRLNFELSAFLANMPRHWNRQEGNARTDDDEARIWAVGQLATARQALKLLDYQANTAAEALRNNEQIHWPEFADYDCYGCHHQLQTPEERKAAAAIAGRRPGTFVWGSWYTPMLPLIGSRQAAPGFSALSKVVEVMGKPLPDTTAVRNAVAPALAELDGQLDAIKASKPDSKQTAELMAAVAAGAEADRWDHAVQVYLALVALQNAQTVRKGHIPTDRDSKINSALAELREKLRFPTVTDQASGRQTILYNSPRDFNPPEVRALVQKLRELIALQGP